VETTGQDCQYWTPLETPWTLQSMLRHWETDCGLSSTIEHSMALNMLTGPTTWWKMSEIASGSTSTTMPSRASSFTNLSEKYKTTDTWSKLLSWEWMKLLLKWLQWSGQVSYQEQFAYWFEVDGDPCWTHILEAGRGSARLQIFII